MGANALWVKRGNSLVPADPVTQAMIAGMPNLEFVQTSAPKQPRNPDFHRLMMATLQIVLEHCHPRFADMEELMDYLKLKSGMVKEVQIEPHLVKVKFKSISFAAMDETKFRRIADQWLGIVCGELMPGTDPDTLLMEGRQAA